MSERCGVCGKPMPESLDEAIDLGWTPEWDYGDGSEGKGPACPECAVRYMDFNEDKLTLILKPWVKLPLESP